MHRSTRRARYSGLLPSPLLSAGAASAALRRCLASFLYYSGRSAQPLGHRSGNLDGQRKTAISAPGPQRARRVNQPGGGCNRDGRDCAATRQPSGERPRCGPRFMRSGVSARWPAPCAVMQRTPGISTGKLCWQPFRDGALCAVPTSSGNGTARLRHTTRDADCDRERRSSDRQAGHRCGKQ